MKAICSFRLSRKGEMKAFCNKIWQFYTFLKSISHFLLFDIIKFHPNDDGSKILSAFILIDDNTHSILHVLRSLLIQKLSDALLLVPLFNCDATNSS